MSVWSVLVQCWNSTIDDVGPTNIESALAEHRLIKCMHLFSHIMTWSLASTAECLQLSVIVGESY